MVLFILPVEGVRQFINEGKYCLNPIKNLQWISPKVCSRVILELTTNIQDVSDFFHARKHVRDEDQVVVVNLLGIGAESGVDTPEDSVGIILNWEDFIIKEVLD